MSQHRIDQFRFLKNDVLRSAKKAKVDEATISFMLDSASKRLDEGKFKDRPLIEASIRETLGGIYADIGELRKGERHYLHAIQLYQQHLGDEHRDTVRAQERIAYGVYEEQGQYEEMANCFARNLQIKQHVHGIEHPVGTMNGLGAAYLYLGKYEDAARVLEVTLELEAAWHEQNAKAFDVYPYIKGNLARVYTAQGRYEEAEGLFAQTGYNEWPTVFPFALADMYREQGRYSKAEALLDRYLKMQRQNLGDGHYHTLLPMQVLAHLYIDQDRYEEAEDLLGEALPIARRRFREDHPLTLRFVNARAVLHTKQGEYDDAESLFKEALKGRRSELGDDHPETLETINDLGILHRQQQHYGEAERLLTEAFEGRKIKLGNTHPHTEESFNNFIELYEVWNKPEKVEEWRAKLPQRKAVKE
ncbi:tetratricopeptide repeat protein [Planctomycetota bacterium]